MTGATLITGANRGIGRALLERFAARGETIGTTRGVPPHDVTGARWASLDVTDPASHADFATELDGKPLSLLVCNAGVYLDKGERLSDGFPLEMWEQTFAANVFGVFMTVQSLLPNLQAVPGSKIAIVSSQMGSSERAGGGSYIYRSSKAAALNLGANLATDLQGLGIAVGIYHPGWVRTDMGTDAAAISTDESADGLMARFEALSMETTGCFENWDGRPHPF